HPMTKPEKKSNWPHAPVPAAELRDICQTMTGLPSPSDQLATRLQYLADLVTHAGRLADAPMLLWREGDRNVSHQAIGEELIVGRQIAGPGLALAEDKLLSRRHFVIRTGGESFTIEDLKSHNGTAINRPEDRVADPRALRDGDLIF